MLKSEHSSARAMAQYKAFADSCLKQHPADIVEYAHDLVQQGCKIELPKAKDDQKAPKVTDSKLSTGVAPWLPKATAVCRSMDDLFTRIQQVQMLCCGADKDCATGFPKSCSTSCAVAFHGMYTGCGLLLGAVIPPRQLEAYNHFDAICLSKVDIKSFLSAISEAECKQRAVRGSRAYLCQK